MTWAGMTRKTGSYLVPPYFSMYPTGADVVLVLTLTVVMEMPKNSKWNSIRMVDSRCCSDSEGNTSLNGGEL